MIRFLNLKDQIEPGLNSFAFYNTITDSIMAFYEGEVFDEIEDFIDSYNQTGYKDHDSYQLERFIRLIPENFFHTPNK